MPEERKPEAQESVRGREGGAQEGTGLSTLVVV